MQILNIGRKSDDPLSRRLNNSSDDSFDLDGQRIASVKGFIHGIKYPEGHPNRAAAFNAVGFEAKRYGSKFALLRVHGYREFVWWQGRTISYGSPAHHELIERAIRAKFDQNPEALKALIATRGMEITHDLGKPESSFTSLPARVFCDILTRIREEALQAQTV